MGILPVICYSFSASSDKVLISQTTGRKYGLLEKKKTHGIFLHLTPPHLAPRTCDQTARLLPLEGS